MNIRRLLAGDADAACRVIEGLKFTMDGVTDLSVEPGYMRSFLADARHYLLAAYDNHEPVGYLFAYLLRRFDGRPPTMFVYEVGVAEQHRRRGIGRALVGEIERLARADGCRKMFVLTGSGNEAAVALYRAAGGREGDADPSVSFWWNW